MTAAAWDGFISGEADSSINVAELLLSYTADLRARMADMDFDARRAALRALHVTVRALDRRAYEIGPESLFGAIPHIMSC